MRGESKGLVDSAVVAWFIERECDAGAVAGTDRNALPAVQLTPWIRRVRIRIDTVEAGANDVKAAPDIGSTVDQEHPKVGCLTRTLFGADKATSHQASDAHETPSGYIPR